MALCIFWAITLVLSIIALICVAPYIHKLYVPVFLVLIYAGFLLYGKPGYIQAYYEPQQVLNRSSNKKLRPLYARLQRELIKQHYGMALDPDNTELILNFAAVYAYLNRGELPKEVKDLLKAVLKQHPQQQLAQQLLSRDAE